MPARELLPWTLSTREARLCGISDEELRGPGYAAVRRGIHVPIGVDVGHPDVRIAAVAAQLPDHAAVAGWAAARLHEQLRARDALDVFDGGRRWEERAAPPATRSALRGAARVVVCSPRDSRLVVREDVRVFRSELLDGDVVLLDGMRVTTGARTAFDLARLLPTAAAVIGLDRLLHIGAVQLEDVDRLVHERRRWTGRARARLITSLADGGAESPQETLLRLLWCSAGLPRPRANRRVLDGAGRFVARVDLIDPDVGVVGEYDGAVHAGAGSRSADAARQEALEALGLVVIRATAVDVDQDGRGVAWQQRLRAAYARARRRPAALRRWVVEDGDPR